VKQGRLEVTCKPPSHYRTTRDLTAALSCGDLSLLDRKASASAMLKVAGVTRPDLPFDHRLKPASHRVPVSSAPNAAPEGYLDGRLPYRAALLGRQGARSRVVFNLGSQLIVGWIPSAVLERAGPRRRGGVLGLLRGGSGSHLSSIFGRTKEPRGQALRLSKAVALHVQYRDRVVRVGLLKAGTSLVKVETRGKWAVVSLPDLDWLTLVAGKSQKKTRWLVRAKDLQGASPAQ